MKKIFYCTLSLFFISALLSSCASKKSTKQALGEVEIKIPCSEINSDKKYFRANTSRKSTDMAMSRRKAYNSASERLVLAVSQQVSIVTKDYLQDREIGEDSEYSSKFESYSLNAAKEQLSDVAVVCEKTMKSPDGKYTTYIALEVDKDIILNGIKRKISKDEKLRQDYDEQKFEDTFNKGMESLENERN